MKSLKQYLYNTRLRLYEIKSELDDKVLAGATLSEREQEQYITVCSQLDIINDIFVICNNRNRY